MYTYTYMLVGFNSSASYIGIYCCLVTYMWNMYMYMYMTYVFMNEGRWLANAITFRADTEAAMYGTETRDNQVLGQHFTT